MLKSTVSVLAHVLMCGIAGFLGGLPGMRYYPQSLPVAVPDAVTAKRFRVIDPDGRIAAELSSEGLNLFGADGQVRATLRLSYNSKGVLAFSDGRWEGRAQFGFLGTDTPTTKDDDWGLRIHAPKDNDESVVLLATQEDGKSGGLLLRNTRKNTEVAVPPERR